MSEPEDTEGLQHLYERCQHAWCCTAIADTSSNHPLLTDVNPPAHTLNPAYLQVAADLQTQLSSTQQLIDAEQQEAASCRMQLRQQKQRHEQQLQQQRHAHEQQLQDLQQDLEQQLEQKEEAMRKVQVGCKAPLAVLT